MEAVTGDASTRVYRRVRFGDGARPASVIAMCMGEGRLAPDDDFLVLAAFLEGRGVPVPRVLAVAPDAGVAFLEDLGDERMADRLAGADRTDRLALYHEALDVLLHLQTGAPPPRGNPAAGRAFDVEKYTFEMNDFVDSYLVRHRRLGLGPRRARLDEVLGRVSAYLARLPRVFAHRDYHARNLMVREGRLRVIDFQDARMGPAEYDVASLLRDSYIVLEDAEREALLAHYARGRGLDARDPEFRRRFAWSALQRNLKAIGTFARLADARGLTGYLESIPPTLAYVRRALDEDASLAFVAKELAPLLDGSTP
ncbi:MAG: phosphotransferase [Myxococcales bacterium]|nr:phosphotransferase [Myxococcales bacterium]